MSEADAPARVDFTGGLTDVPPLVDGATAVHVNAAVAPRVHARPARAPGDPRKGWRLASDLGLDGVVVAADDPQVLLATSPERGFLSVLIEDDPALAQAFLAAELVDRINPEQ